MIEVLHYPSSPSTNTTSSTTTPPPTPSPLSCAPPSPPLQNGFLLERQEEEEEGEERDPHISLLALLLTLIRKSLLACKSDRREHCAMEIGWPTNVRHVAHVTFDRFNGFLGLPVELEPEVPRRPPSASAKVFGVSTESMQLSYDSRGNCVPMILLLMQRRLYDQGGLQAEGIFRINAENSQEEYVREQLNSGVVPEGIDVHCLAGLIKAWFRELPCGVLDSLSPNQVIDCQTEEDCAELVRNLPPAEAALLDWAINLMADVVQQEYLNKMNARNLAMVFAPNMTQMADPLTALKYAVEVMNFLKTLILRTIREREDSVLEPTRTLRLEPFDESDHECPLHDCVEATGEDNEKIERHFLTKEPSMEISSNASQCDVLSREDDHCSATSISNLRHYIDPCQDVACQDDNFVNETCMSRVNGLEPGIQAGNDTGKVDQSSNLSKIKAPCRTNVNQSLLGTEVPVENQQLEPDGFKDGAY